MSPDAPFLKFSTEGASGSCHVCTFFFFPPPSSCFSSLVTRFNSLEILQLLLILIAVRLKFLRLFSLFFFSFLSFSFSLVLFGFFIHIFFQVQTPTPPACPQGVRQLGDSNTNPYEFRRHALYATHAFDPGWKKDLLY